MNKLNLESGDRVKVVEAWEQDQELAGIENGDTGTVVGPMNTKDNKLLHRWSMLDYVVVLMDRPINGHNAFGICNTRQAWYFVPGQLEVIPPAK